MVTVSIPEFTNNSYLFCFHLGPSKIEEQPEIDIGLDETKIPQQVFKEEEIVAENQKFVSELWSSQGKLEIV